MEKGYTIPIVDLAGETERQTILDREEHVYLGHVTTVLLEDGRTILAVYPKNHGNGSIVLKRSTDGGLKRSYYLDCLIEGTTDFIFGPSIAYFENCTILSKKDSYITAASTPQGEKYGYVFKDCRLEAAPGVTKVFLGRPWRPYARTVYIGCEMGAHIRPEGWHDWNKPEAHKTAFYAEYGSTGPGADSSNRVKWSKQLTARQAAEYTFEKVMGRGGSAAWNPFDNR